MNEVHYANIVQLKCSITSSLSTHIHTFSTTTATIIIIVLMENPLRFDVLVNGGGAITLQFQRSPFRPMTRTVFVPWNQVNYHCHCIKMFSHPPTHTLTLLSFSSSQHDDAATAENGKISLPMNTLLGECAHTICQLVASV
jgi:hypothetical protein